MKKLIAFVLIVAVIAGGYVWLRKYGQLEFEMFKGVTDTVKRGDLEVPITASGRIEPASITKIKGEASGAVSQTPQRIGEMVKKGDLIIALDPEDEQRNVDRAIADYERAKIALERAKIARQEAEKVGLPLAQAEKDQAEARLGYIQIEHTQKAKLKDSPDILMVQEWQAVELRLREAQAALAAANAKLEQARMAIEFAEKDVATMEQNERVAKKTLEDAQERLRETEIRSPIDGMILKRYVEVGEVVQSGKTSLTGGTILVDLADVSEIYAVVNVDEADIGLVRELAPEEARPGPRPQTSANNQANAAENESGEVASSQPMRELDPDVLDTTQRVKVTVESFPDEEFYGVIERIAPQSELSQAIATFKVWIRITSPNKSLLVGLLNVQAEAHFTAKSVTNALLVSYDAFQREGDDFGVYVPVKDPQPGQKKYEFRRCEFGRDNGIMVEVRSGLNEGDEVYVKLPVQTRKEEKEAEAAED
ncbi:MAG TPA: HlyD family efflux transporter periplasmic adaptor subunit [Phycisphaerae bacterium]|nr:HlyD family efflux transporter periplasmic adaptor subunit [Phycisphaerae bacterium]HOJ74843.1 HlyD family efflux transporter periplasmic adaptor subunit [Phycisphaerae bacterium]HOM52006.1 HlyD family efflux transporter periplasmic adaptor subunit [Phycisphaerae bacterium]HON68628.1 HlyD family efflux transporter periplasmic adaptor subunit [Phycisphaerae bacterium]HOQ86470.1 HlyD family efflux transporter periplasmic adaptor subunit [Phycisphaerae bacterium]